MSKTMEKTILLGKLMLLKAKLDKITQPDFYKALSLLLECATLLEQYENGGNDENVFSINTFLADWYNTLGHYPLAIKHYKKAIEFSEKLEMTEDLTDTVEQCYWDLLKACRKLDNAESFNEYLEKFKKAMPDRAAKFEKQKSVGLKYDPFEVTQRYFEILPELEEKIAKQLIKEKNRYGHGYCYTYWQVKCEILEKDYGVVWESPSILNMGVHFD